MWHFLITALSPWLCNHFQSVFLFAPRIYRNTTPAPSGAKPTRSSSGVSSQEASTCSRSGRGPWPGLDVTVASCTSRPWRRVRKWPALGGARTLLNTFHTWPALRSSVDSDSCSSNREACWVRKTASMTSNRFPPTNALLFSGNDGFSRRWSLATWRKPSRLFAHSWKTGSV